MTLLSRLASEMQLMLRRPPRQQYGAICYRPSEQGGGIEVLLMTSRDSGRWVIPKGWPMHGKRSHEAAAQEALEEAGIIGLVGEDPLGAYSYVKVLKNGLGVDCRVQVYPLAVTGQAKKFKEKGQRRFEWVPPAEAAERVREPELKALFLHCEALLQKRAPAKRASGQ